MTRMVEVPEDDLRLILECYGSDGRDELNALARLEALLPPVLVPVTKHTEWGTEIVRLGHPDEMAVFIAPVPWEIHFVRYESGSVYPSNYGDWVESPEPEPVRVPVEVGQKRRDPKTKEGCVVVRKRSGPGGLPQALLLYPDEDNVWWPLADVKGWELIQ